MLDQFRSAVAKLGQVMPCWVRLCQVRGG